MCLYTFISFQCNEFQSTSIQWRPWYIFQKCSIWRFIIIQCYMKCFPINLLYFVSTSIATEMRTCFTRIEIWGDESVMYVNTTIKRYIFYVRHLFGEQLSCINVKYGHRSIIYRLGLHLVIWHTIQVLLYRLIYSIHKLLTTVLEDNCLEFRGVCFHLVFSKPV